jgi:hypothetical protein
LDENTSQNQCSLGTQLGEDVGSNIVVAWNILEFDSLEVAIEFLDLNAVRVHCVFDTISLFIDMFYDNLGITIGKQLLDAQGHSDAEPMY